MRLPAMEMCRIPAIGRARRMQVTTPVRQHGVMIEAVENHMPQVIVIDEMGTEEEAAAARTIAERGVQLIATAHGNTLDNLILNPHAVGLGRRGPIRNPGRPGSPIPRHSEIRPGEKSAAYFRCCGGDSKLGKRLRCTRTWPVWSTNGFEAFPIAPNVRWLDESGQIHRDQEAPRRSDDAPPPWSPDAPDRSYRPASGQSAASGQ